MQDNKLPSYYQHLREASIKPPPPDVAQQLAEGERAHVEPAHTHSQVYGPLNAPAGERHQGRGPPGSAPYADYRPVLGSRSGLGAGGGAAPGEYSHSLATRELLDLSRGGGMACAVAA